MRASGEDLKHIRARLAQGTRETFLKEHALPLLVVEIKDERVGEGFGTKLVEGGEEALEPMTAPPTFTARSTHVFSVEKSDRNGFVDMIAVGRTSNNDIVIPDRSVSKFHAYFKKELFAERYMLVDGGSSNGTAIGTRRLTPRSSAPVPSGTRIWFGPLVRALFLDPGAFWDRFVEGD